MYGGVGCGKTMLMDLLVAAAPKQFFLRRVHFHDFMLEVHQMLQALSGEQVRCRECLMRHLPAQARGFLVDQVVSTTPAQLYNAMHSAESCRESVLRSA